MTHAYTHIHKLELEEQNVPLKTVTDNRVANNKAIDNSLEPWFPIKYVWNTVYSNEDTYINVANSYIMEVPLSKDGIKTIE